MSLAIMDIQGREVYKITNANAFVNNNVTISGNELTKGMYFYKIENKHGESATGRFVICD